MLESGPLILKNERASLKIVYDFERVTGVEPVFLPWQGNVIAAIRYPRHSLSYGILPNKSIIKKNRA